MDFAEVNVDQKFHPHVIGKNGANGRSSLDLSAAMLVKRVL